MIIFKKFDFNLPSYLSQLIKGLAGEKRNKIILPILPKF